MTEGFEHHLVAIIDLLAEEGYNLLKSSGNGGALR